MTGDIVVMFSSPEAAQRKTVSGWVSRLGHFFGDGLSAEQAARFDGCTDYPCNRCGRPIPKNNFRCHNCREINAIERYEALPRMPWDGTSYLFSEKHDCYYTSLEDAEEDLIDGETLADLRLVICKPNYVPVLSYEYLDGVLGDDDDGNPQVLKAIDDFNAAVADIIVSWSPGMVALEVPGAY